MHYHIILTELCNSQCRYCYGKSMCEENDLNKRFKFDFDAPQVSAVEVGKIRKFLLKDEEPILVFYGGEPLLQVDKIKELIDTLSDVPNIQFRMQTNGRLLDKFDINYLKKIGKILVSVDGTRERTDFNKGEGTYDKVIGNLRTIRELGYDGEVVVRMCVSGFSDIYEQVMHLVGLTTCDLSKPFAGHLLRPPSRPDSREQFSVGRSRARDQLSQKMLVSNVKPKVSASQDVYPSALNSVGRKLSQKSQPVLQSASVYDDSSAPSAPARPTQIVSACSCELRKPNYLSQKARVKSIGQRGIFDSIHWQLDMGFYSCDYNFEKVSKFVEEYNLQITKLVDWWISEMKKGKVWKLYPFVGLVENLLSGAGTKLMCGAGHSGYTITTDGNLVACPIMGCMPDFYCGDLDSSPSELREIGPASRCEGCDYLKDCGGRCLYVNKMKLWPPEGMDLICSTVKHLIDLLKGKLPEVRLLVGNGVVSEGDFEYEKYFGPEIVP